MNKMKRICSVAVSALLALSILSSCKDKSTAKGDELIWGAFTTEAKNVVYEMYNYEIPMVTDPDGKELPVKVVITDAEGNVVDSVGGFIAIRGLQTYTITYTVEYNGKTYTKTATVTGIPKADYTLQPFPLFGVGEEVNLDAIVTTAVDTKRAYSIRKDGQSVAVADGKFIPENSGSYDVTVSIANQKDYTFTVFVVDKSEYATPNGQITEANEGDFTASPVKYTGTTGEENGTCEMSMSTETFDGSEGQSTKFDIDFPTDCKTFDVDISYTPEFPLAYYKTLKEQGYQEIAVRMKVSHSNPVNFGFGFGGYFNSSKKIQVYDDTGKCLQNATDKALWNYLVPNNVWQELVLPIDSFIGSYNASGMNLFTYRTFTNAYGNLDLWIDNIYAVKPMGGTQSAALQELPLGTQYDVLAGLEYTPDIDVDEQGVMKKFNRYDTPITLTEGKAMLDKKAIYNFSIQAKNRYGALKKSVSTFPTKGLVSNRLDTSAFSVTGVEDWGSYEYDESVKFSDSDTGSVKFTLNNTAGTTNLTFKTEFDKAYYQALKGEGYDYVAFRFRRDFSEGGTEGFIYGSIGYKLPYALVNFNEDGSIKTLEQRTEQGVYQFRNADDGWWELRIPLRAWLATFNGATSSMKIQLDRFTDTNQKTYFWFGGCYLVDVVPSEKDYDDNYVEIPDGWGN